MGLQLRQRDVYRLDPGQLRRGGTGLDQQEELPTLVLPVGQNVEIALDSRDVIHSFWVVDFLYKKDMFPGKTNYMSFVPEREGTYEGKCAELCGEYHSLMLFNVEVVSRPSTTTTSSRCATPARRASSATSTTATRTCPAPGRPSSRRSSRR